MNGSFEESIRQFSNVKIAVRAARLAIRPRDWRLRGSYKLPLLVEFQGCCRGHVM